MNLLRRFFGTPNSAREADDGQGPGPTAAPAVGSTVARPVSMTVYSDRFVHIDELDLSGSIVTSPNGRFAIVVGSVFGGDGDYDSRTRDGAFAVLEGGLLRVSGTAERPQEGKVADSGAFVISDWLHGDGLKGRFLGFHPDGSLAFAHEFSANLGVNGLSAEGRYAACQTYRSPDSPDSCIVGLFDLEQGELLARISPQCGTAQSFEFDGAQRHIHILTTDGDRETYGFDGAMVDRDAWLDRRIARGDLKVIGDLLKAGGLGAALVDKLRAGLSRAQTEGETWAQARALRLDGELLEAIGCPQEALAAYDRALLLDPQVGVSRRADKLRRSFEGDSKPARRLSRFEQQAQRLGIRHEAFVLNHGGPKQWRHGDAGPYLSVEEAALDRYLAEGWSGAAAEGGLILTLIKGASFAPLAARNADTFVEALYAQNIAFDEDRFDPKHLIATLERADEAQLRSNWRMISATAGSSPAYYPRVRWEHVEGLFKALGNRRLAEIATVFATAPYELRAGWPDLTLWRGSEVCFVEVKAPSDQMHASQARLISTLLVPLGFDVALAEVRRSA